MKAVIFDWGGVTIREFSEDIQKDIMAAFDINETEFLDAYKKTLPPFVTGEITEDVFWTRFSLSVDKPLPVDHMKLFFNTFRTEYNQEVLDKIESLRGKARIGLISNTMMPYVLYHRARNDYHMFEEIILSCEVGLAKPDKRIFQLMLDRMGVSGPDCVFIDNKESYMSGARELGIQTIVYTGPESIKDV